MQKELKHLMVNLNVLLTSNNTFIDKYPKYATKKGVLHQIKDQLNNEIIIISIMCDININGYDNYDIENHIIDKDLYNITLESVNNCLIGY